MDSVGGLRELLGLPLRQREDFWDRIVGLFLCTNWPNIPHIMADGLRPGGHGGSHQMTFLSPWAPWSLESREANAGGQSVGRDNTDDAVSVDVPYLLTLGELALEMGQPLRQLYTYRPQHAHDAREEGRRDKVSTITFGKDGHFAGSIQSPIASRGAG